ncbi:MAG: PTS sugar transporter subunit IIA, partial [Chromatiales bacterium]|nr:PTS sugar transporter subunit IIA [Chromatiales bacterium]
NISEILEPGRVLGNVEARSKKRALEILSELLGHAGEECVANDIFENLVQREKLGCSALGRGVAVPHGRSPGLSGPAAAFVKLHEPVDFDAADGERVDLIFGLLVPEEATENQSAALADVTRLMADATLRGSLREATSSSTLYQLLADAADRLTT